jgi:hypothetical protein
VGDVVANNAVLSVVSPGRGREVRPHGSDFKLLHGFFTVFLASLSSVR